MALTVEAIYEDGVLKPAQPLPLKEHEQVRITVHTDAGRVASSYGLLGWTGDAETVRRIALEDEFGVRESR